MFAALARWSRPLGHGWCAAAILVLVGCAPASSSPSVAASAIGSVSASPAPAITVTITVSASDCIVDPALDEPIAAGPIVIQAVNATEFPAAFDVWSIEEDATYDDFAAYIDQERELAEAGEAGLGHPGFVGARISSGILEVGANKAVHGAFTRGTWAIACFKHFEAVTDDPFRPFIAVGPIIVE